MSDTQPTFACDLGALNAEERAQRSTLASRVAARFREVQELADGYAARLDPDAAVARDALDWLLLEQRCCRSCASTCASSPPTALSGSSFEAAPGRRSS